jgi:hypothetical protein
LQLIDRRPHPLRRRRRQTRSQLARASLKCSRAHRRSHRLELSRRPSAFLSRKALTPKARTHNRSSIRARKISPPPTMTICRARLLPPLPELLLLSPPQRRHRATQAQTLQAVRPDARKKSPLLQPPLLQMQLRLWLSLPCR